MTASTSPDRSKKRLRGLLNSSATSRGVVFTAAPIAEAVVDAHQRGVQVSGVIETGQANNTGSDYQYLLDSGVDVHLDGNPRNMHHKVFIIDGQIVILGSYNFSRSAEERNDENLLVIHSTELATRFEQEFDLIFLSAP